MAEVEVQVRLQCAREGPAVGSGVVLSHGLGDDRSTWDELVPLLAVQHPVVSWDLRGHGDSDAPADASAYSLETAVSDLVSIIGDAGAPLHLVGHSLGGLVSLVVALRRPELVRSLTMIASGPGYRDVVARQAWNRFVDDAVLAMPIPAVAGGLARQESSWVIDHVGELIPPLLVVVGERDTRFQPSAAVLERRVRGCTCLRVAGAGHHVQRTHAGEVAAAVLAHVDAADERGEGGVR